MNSDKKIQSQILIQKDIKSMSTLNSARSNTIWKPYNSQSSKSQVVSFRKKIDTNSKQVYVKEIKRIRSRNESLIGNGRIQDIKFSSTIPQRTTLTTRIDTAHQQELSHHSGDQNICPKKKSIQNCLFKHEQKYFANFGLKKQESIDDIINKMSKRKFNCVKYHGLSNMDYEGPNCLQAYFFLN